MASSPIALRDGNDILFNQAAATNTDGDKIPQSAVTLWNSASPTPVSATNPLPITPGTGVVFNLGTIGGAATETTLSALSAKLPSTLSSGNLRVSLQESGIALAVTQSGTWNINNITGTIPLPTGAATDRTSASGPFSVRLSDGTSFLSALAVTQSGTWTVQPGNTPNTTPWLFSLSDGTNTATIRNLTANDALNVAVTDGSGNHITSFGGTQYIQGTSVASPTGNVVMWRNSTGNIITDVSDVSPLPVQISPATDVSYLETLLSAPGTTTIRSFAGYRRATCTFTVATINTSVTVRIEGRVASAGNWFSLLPRSLNGAPVNEVLTANGDYAYYIETCLEEIRFNFVSEAGGTDATILVRWRFGT